MKDSFSPYSIPITWLALAGPFLFFLAFLLSVWGWLTWAAGLAILAIVVSRIFSRKCPPDEQAERWDTQVMAGVSIAAVILLMLWLDTIPEWDAFLDRLFANGAAKDWRFIAAVFLWMCLWAYADFKKAILQNTVRDKIDLK
jgi:hypothetical protein